MIGWLDRLGRFRHWRRRGEQFAGAGEVGAAFAAGEQAVVADAVEARAAARAAGTGG